MPQQVNSGAIYQRYYVANTSATALDLLKSLTATGGAGDSSCVVISNFPATQPVSGTVSVNALPASSNVIGHVIVDTAPTTAVTGTFYQATQPVSGTVSVNALPASSNVIGHVVVDTAPSTTVTNTGTFAVQSALNAETTKVIGTVNVAASQTIATTNAGTFAVQAAQSGSWTVQPGNTANTTAWKVDGSAVTQPVSNAGLTNIDAALSTRLKPADTLTGVTTVGTVTTLTGITNALPAGTNQIGAVTLGTATGKTLVMKTGSLATTATTADQVVLTYTVTSAKTFYLEYFDCYARITTQAATASVFGTYSLESPAGTKLYTGYLFGAGGAMSNGQPPAEPIPIAAGAVIRIVCTPSASTAWTWIANFGGFEK